MTEWIEGPPQRIAVFRALMPGDMLCAVPALRALKAAFPEADIALIGLPWARTLAQRLPYVDEFIEFPGHPGLPGAACGDVRALPDFLARVQAHRFDLALQMHGSDAIANPLVHSFGARQTAGFRAPDGWVPEHDASLFCRWPERDGEVERLLALIDHLDVPRRGTHLEFPLQDEDRAALLALWPDARRHSYVCMHVSAQSPQRCDPRRFAAVADTIAERGHTVVLAGSAAETGWAEDIAACMEHTPLNLCGHTTLWTLGALIEGAERLVCTDSSVSHIAAALRRPSTVLGADTGNHPLLRAARALGVHAVQQQPSLVPIGA